ncbi:MAG: tRNA (adenosine(37)-N6)-dimethylallyltransferase MiaA [Longimicrobiales bacterium]
MPHPSRPAFLAITGPTASGKTDLSLALAERLDGEVVSMDSRQVYRGMDVGTDKVDQAGRRRVPHHGLDLVAPDERYSAGRFARDARRWVADIRSRERVPLLVGGTGFFLRALMQPIFTEPDMDPARRARLREWLAGQSAEALARWVRVLDPDRADVAVEGGPQRIGRTLEVALLTGRPLSWWHRHAPPDGAAVPGAVVALEIPREEMDRRIDDRVSRMVERGLVDEVRGLLAAGYGPDDPGMTGTGYPEILRFLDGTWSMEEAVEEIRRNTRRYARRQLTWFRHQLPESTVRIDATAPLGAQVDAAAAAWEAAQVAAGPPS